MTAVARTSGTAHRLQSPWLYTGPAAARHPGINAGQVDYAITLRRQLAERLEREARAQLSTSIAYPIWLPIVTACRREQQRCDRAQRRLARAKAGAP